MPPMCDAMAYADDVFVADGSLSRFHDGCQPDRVVGCTNFDGRFATRV